MGMSDSDGKISGLCPQCGQEHRFDPFWNNPRTVPLCDPCAEWQELSGHGKKKTITWEDSYRSALPEEYQRAEIGQVPPCYVGALDWTAEEFRGGLGLIGPSGEGKSCAIACLLWKLETRFLWLFGSQARDMATQSAMTDHPNHADACRSWQKALDIPILVLDDISQGVMTAAWAAKLLALLEIRKSHGRPTFWTSQLTLPELREKLGRQSGGETATADATSRRLGQQSLVLHA
jgi:hypothetical protein